MLRGLVGYGVARALALDDRRPATAAGIRAAQDRELARILARLASTAVGRRFGLADIRDAAAFRTRVAPTTYADYADELARCARGDADVLFPGRPRALAQTSGTTSSGAAGERFIPQGDDLLDHHARGGRAALARLAAAAGPRLFAGRMLMLGGSTSLAANAHGVPVGDLSGIVVDRIPAWLQGFYEPGRAIALESDWERKLARIVERLAHRDVRLISGIPSWMLVLFDRLCRARGVDRLRDAWPRLAGLIHGGHAIAPTLPLLRHHLDPATRLVEVYPASEGFIAVGSRAWTLDEDGPPPLACLCAHGLWLDFLPEDGGPAVGADGLEDGRLYRILVTTPGGLLRYQIGDLVRGCGPGLLRVAGRVRCRISVFGEHVEGDHLDAALAAAGIRVAHYHVAPVLPTATDPRGRHEWWIESPDAIDPAAVAAAIDRHLRGSVLDYDAHRAGDQQLLAPTVVAVPAGTFAAALAAQGKLGGQHKVPQAWADRTIADRLAAAASLP
jgi:hypothetical protein